MGRPAVAGRPTFIRRVPAAPAVDEKGILRMSDHQQASGRFCPNCGTQVDEAKFCPECGTDLIAVRRALRGEQPSAADVPARTVRTTGGRRRAGADTGPAEPSGPRPPAAAVHSRGLSPWILIGGAAVAVAVILVVVLLGVKGGTSSGSTSTSTSSQSATPVAADTSGTYAQLVSRANGLYDQGGAAFGKNLSQSVNYFGAAAKIYQAAWQKKAGDPNVGTDWATSVFYSGDIQSALSIVEMVLAKNPSFQPALFNKGNFLFHQAQQADPTGKSAESKKLNAQAKAVYQQAAAVDPKSDIGKQAAAAAAAL